MGAPGSRARSASRIGSRIIPAVSPGPAKSSQVLFHHAIQQGRSLSCGPARCDPKSNAFPFSLLPFSPRPYSGEGGHHVGRHVVMVVVGVRAVSSLEDCSHPRVSASPRLAPSSFILHPSSFILHRSSFIPHPSSLIILRPISTFWPAILYSSAFRISGNSDRPRPAGPALSRGMLRVPCRRKDFPKVGSALSVFGGSLHELLLPSPTREWGRG